MGLAFGGLSCFFVSAAASFSMLRTCGGVGGGISSLFALSAVWFSILRICCGVGGGFSAFFASSAASFSSLRICGGVGGDISSLFVSSAILSSSLSVCGGLGGGGLYGCSSLFVSSVILSSSLSVCGGLGGGGLYGCSLFVSSAMLSSSVSLCDCTVAPASSMMISISESITSSLSYSTLSFAAGGDDSVAVVACSALYKLSVSVWRGKGFEDDDGGDNALSMRASLLINIPSFEDSGEKVTEGRRL